VLVIVGERVWVGVFEIVGVWVMVKVLVVVGVMSKWP